MDLNYVNINITDNGKGYDHRLINKEKKGLGLVGMKERVRHMNGSFKIRSFPGKGTRILIKIAV